MPFLAANCPSGLGAALRGGDHQGLLLHGVELLGHGGTALFEVDADLVHVLLDEGNLDIFVHKSLGL